MMSEQTQQEKENTETEPEYEETIQEMAEAIKEEEESELSKYRKKMRKKGLILADVYHCQRCNYVWLPKDFAVKVINEFTSDDRLMHMEPPKVCARCKSRQWNSPPKRKTERIFDCTCGEKHHDMFTSKNLKAAYRRYVRDITEQDKRIKHLEEFAKRKGIRLEE